MSLINVSMMFCLLCVLSQNSSLRDAKPAGHLFVWFAKHCLAKHCLSFWGDADECEKQFRFVLCICVACFAVRLHWALVCIWMLNSEHVFEDLYHNYKSLTWGLWNFKTTHFYELMCIFSSLLHFLVVITFRYINFKIFH